ncbi:hypothetical protein GC194_00690 [bacterium]|nr:hypothetical protein [bacterium]
MTNPPIVIPVYQRVKSLTKLLWSLERSHIPQDTLLIFKSHKGAANEVLTLVENYHWPFGEKKHLHSDAALGLDQNLLECGDLSLEFDAVVILEDDLIVSPFFYSYALQAITQYQTEEDIAQISLCQYGHHPISGYVNYWIQDGFDAFMLQKTSTWGQVFTAKQWLPFKEWLSQQTIDKHRIPEYIVSYGPQNWEFLHNAYLIATNRYSVWPRLSLSTNQGSAGTHHKNDIDAGFFQVPLQNIATDYCWPSFAQALKYDAWFELHPSFFNSLLKEFRIDFQQVETDLHGHKPLSVSNKPYWLTSKPCNEAIASFSSELKPKEINILWHMKGDYIKLCRKENLVKDVKKSTAQNALEYFAEVPDVGLWNFLKFKWLKYVERKRLSK